jgi:hypothetical protein
VTVMGTIDRSATQVKLGLRTRPTLGLVWGLVFGFGLGIGFVFLFRVRSGCSIIYRGWERESEYTISSRFVDEID